MGSVTYLCDFEQITYLGSNSFISGMGNTLFYRIMMIKHNSVCKVPGAFITGA